MILSDSLLFPEATGQDILCPAGRAWSDKEGTCVEAPLPTIGAAIGLRNTRLRMPPRMKLTRRQFNHGAMAAATAPSLPPVAGVGVGGSHVPGMQEAYAKILAELARVEEAARGAGHVSRASGAVTWKGRQLEAFLGKLDVRIDPMDSAAEVFRELKEFLNERARLAPGEDGQGQELLEDIDALERSGAPVPMSGSDAPEEAAPAEPEPPAA